MTKLKFKKEISMILGVCGKIASGKSEVMGVLGEFGFHLLYADDIVHALYESGGLGAKKITEVFGCEFLNEDGSVNRKMLRELVFLDIEKLQILNDAIHPLVSDEMRKMISSNGNTAIESVYFDEGLLGAFVDKLLWVDRDVSRIKEVLSRQRGFSDELADKTLLLIQKPEKTDYVIANNGNLDDLKKEVVDLFHP